MRCLYIGLLLTGLTMSANAQVLVLGSGLAKDCYEAAETVRLTPKSSIETCSKALDHEVLSKNDRMSTLINRGILYMRNGEYTQAMADYEDALKINPNKGETFLNIGAAHIYREEYAEAKDAIDKAIELGTTDLYAAYYNRAIAQERLGDITSAYWDYRKSLELMPEFEIAARQLERFTISKEPPADAGGQPA